MTMLSFSEVTKSFGDRVVLDGLSFHLGRGEIYGLLGPNGAGKTTAINILCGFLEPDRGTARVAGELVSKQTRATMGVAPEELSIYQNLTCLQNLRFFGQVFGLRSDTLERRLSTMTKAFRLEEYGATEVNRLSGGWKRRINMAAALVHSPSLLVLDEPTVGVDVEARYELWHIIEHLQDQGVTILLTTHHLQEAETLCDRIGILNNGRIAAEGSLEDLRELVPGKQLLVMETDSQDSARSMASELGWPSRSYRGKLTFLLPQRVTIPEVVTLFEDVPLRSLALEEIALEHVYLQVMQDGDFDGHELIDHSVTP